MLLYCKNNYKYVTKEKQILLVLRAQTGDLEAYNTLLKSIQTKVYWYIWKLLNDKSLADDILQEVFIKIFRKLSLLRQPEFFLPWVFRITTRELFRHLKKQRIKYESSLEEDSIDTYNIEEDKADIDVEKLARLIDKLSPASRAVITLHYNEEMTIKEISDVLEIPTGTVKSRLSYGLKMLRAGYG